MGSAQVFNVKFQVVKAATTGNQAYQYRREPRSALVQAASSHPKDILTVLNADIAGTLSGETIEILSVQAISAGTEAVGSVLT